jgi:hypothetical protein
VPLNNLWTFLIEKEGDHVGERSKLMGRLGQGKDWLALLGNTVENDSLIEAEVVRK